MKKIKLDILKNKIAKVLTRDELKRIHGGSMSCVTCNHSNECSGAGYCFSGCCSDHGGSGCNTCTHSYECSGTNYYCYRGCCAAA